MSDEKRIRDIEARLGAATPGPWGLASADFTLPDDVAVKTEADDIVAICGHPDAALIAHAPADLRWLLDRRRSDNERLRAAVNEHCSCGGMGPGDRQACGACRVWHSAGGRP